MIDIREALERETDRFHQEAGAFERLLRRRDRNQRNRRISAAVLAIVLTLLSIAALMRAFRDAERPATEPTPKPQGIFSDVGGWIVYGPLGEKCEPTPCVNPKGIRAVDPTPRDGENGQIQLTTDGETPLAWSSDGSKLLIRRTFKVNQVFQGSNLFVLNVDGTETRLTKSDSWITGGSFSPDGTKVVYSEEGRATRSSIYLVDAAGGTPQILLPAGPRFPDEVTSFRRTAFPTFSPDGSQIAFVDGWGARGPSSW